MFYQQDKITFFLLTGLYLTEIVYRDRILLSSTFFSIGLFWSDV